MSYPSRSRSPAVEALEDRCVPTTAQFVQNLYGDLLNRVPSGNEAAFWVNGLNARQTSPFGVAASFTNSDEFLTNQIRADYQAILNRTPGPGEVVFWLAARRTGLTARGEAIQFLASNEFFVNAGATNVGWTNAAFAEVLGRAPTLIELNQFAGRPLGFFQVRAQAAAELLFSAESNARTVDAAFRQMLERGVDAGGLIFWGNQLAFGLDSTTLLVHLAASGEYVNTKSGGLDVSTVPPIPGPIIVPNPIPIPNPAPGTNVQQNGTGRVNVDLTTTLASKLPPAPLATSAFVSPTRTTFGAPLGNFSLTTTPFSVGFVS